MEINWAELKKNYELFENLCSKIESIQADKFDSNQITNMLDILGERLLMCPSNMKNDQPGCAPGGMIKFCISVTAKMREMAPHYGMDSNNPSILKVGLFHEIGKVGDLENDYFIEQNSDWNREKLGQYYKWNEECQKMSVSHRTLYLLQHFNVHLSQEEWLTLQLAYGMHFEENRFYNGSEPKLAMLLQDARRIVFSDFG